MHEMHAIALETMNHGHVPTWIPQLRQELLDAGWIRIRGEGLMRHYIVTSAGQETLMAFRRFRFL